MFETDTQRSTYTVIYGDLRLVEIYSGEDAASQFGNAI